MKRFFSVLSVLWIALGAAAANDDEIRIQANRCLKIADDSKMTETDFRNALGSVEALCTTPESKKYFEEFKLLAETKFNMRPLETAMIGITCEDSGLAMSVKPAALADLLETSLDDSFKKITRKDLDKAIEELNLQNSDLFERSNSEKLGSFVGARYIITGNLQKIEDEIVVTARCIEVRTGKIIRDGMVKGKTPGEVADAMVGLAGKLSMRNLREPAAPLSGYAIKYLNAANREIAAGKFREAEENLSRGSMFLTDDAMRNSLIPVQTALAASACAAFRRDYAASAKQYSEILNRAREIFGDSDEVLTQLHCNLSISSLQAGDQEKAVQAYRNALQCYEHTPEGRTGLYRPLAELEGVLEHRESRETLSGSPDTLASRNRAFLLESLQLKTEGTKKPPVAAVASTTAAAAPVTAAAPAASQPSRMSSETAALLLRAEKFKTAEKWTDLLEVLEKIETLDPNNAEFKRICREYEELQKRKAAEAVKRRDFNAAIACLVSPRVTLTPEEMYQLALCQEQVGDLNSARKYFEQAGRQKHIGSLLWLAKYSADGGDTDGAVKNYTLAAEAGEAKANLSLAILFLSEQGGVHDERKGIEYLKLAAKQGVPNAQFNLGCCYANFQGARFASVPYNRAEAVKWLQKAKDNGVSAADKALQRLK